MTNPMQWPEPDLPLCEACLEPIWEDRPGSNWTCVNKDASVFPYNFMEYSVCLHDEEGCIEGYMDGVAFKALRDSPVQT